MRIAIEGCAHGELEIIYDAMEEIENNDGKKIDLLICCGDFQSTRNFHDLASMAVPDKYKDICTFYKYYSGEKLAPVLTIFIGGNHEASNYLQELTYGGWVAPKIYYMGYANVVKFRGVRIAGISGIYNSKNLLKGHFELPPYDDSTIRSVYHTRNLEIFRLKQLTGRIDIFLSHDWPNGITKFGDEKELLKRKPFFKNDIDGNALGSPPCMELLKQHYPNYWFSAHLHCKFAALISNEDKSKITKFLALDKCLPKRRFLQILDIPHDSECTSSMEEYYLSYDLEWLTILYVTNHLLSVKNGIHYMPGPGCTGRWNFTPTESEKNNVYNKFEDNLRIPDNFESTTNSYNPKSPTIIPKKCKFIINKQTSSFCEKLGIDDPSALLQLLNGGPMQEEEKKKGNQRTNKQSDVYTTSHCSSQQYPTKSHDLSTNFEKNFIVDDDNNSFDNLNIQNLNAEEQNERNDNKESIISEPSTKKFKRRNQKIYSDIH